MKIYLDDIRVPEMTYPQSSEWILIRTPEELITCFVRNSHSITHISFDHDLSCFDADNNETTGYDTLKILCEIMMDSGINPEDFTFLWHSQNPVGKENMRMYWENFKNWSQE